MPRESLLIFRAISVPLSCGDQDPGRPVIVIVVFALLALDVGVDGVRDELVGAAGLVLFFSGRSSRPARCHAPSGP